MINTFLDRRLENNGTREELEKIFKEIATGIVTGSGKHSKVLHPVYQNTDGTEKPITLDTVEAYREFLMAPDFYRYHFPRMEGFWYDLKALRGNCALHNLLESKLPKGSMKAFREKYPPDEFEAEYQVLRAHMDRGDKTLSDFREDVGPGSTWNPTDDVERIFRYDDLDPDLRHRILNAMDVTVCPYCNMNYTLKYSNDGTLVNTADVDHFYIKSKFPEYSLCLYNMIPACPVCNSRMKGAASMTVETHVYPHGEGFGDHARFRVTNLPSYLLHRSPDPKIESPVKPKLALDLSPETSPEEQTRILHSSRLFKLEERYQGVSSRAAELIEKAEIYSEGYSRELEREFQKVFRGSSIREMAFGPEESEKQYARRSLGKLRMDLLKQLDIYK